MRGFFCYFLGSYFFRHPPPSCTPNSGLAGILFHFFWWDSPPPPGLRLGKRSLNKGYVWERRPHAVPVLRLLPPPSRPLPGPFFGFPVPCEYPTNPPPELPSRTQIACLKINQLISFGYFGIFLRGLSFSGRFRLDQFPRVLKMSPTTATPGAAGTPYIPPRWGNLENTGTLSNWDIRCLLTWYPPLHKYRGRSRVFSCIWCIHSFMRWRFCGFPP